MPCRRLAALSTSSRKGRVVHDYDHQLASVDDRQLSWPCDIAFVDLETTGFEPDKHDITEIAVIRCDPQFRVRSSYHTRVWVPESARASADPWVFENTAWGTTTAIRWLETSKPLNTALSMAGRLLDGAALCAQYLPFESDWLTSRYKRAPMETPSREWILSNRWRRNSLDTRDMLSPYVARGELSSRSLAAACSRFGIPLENHHDALCDARATRELAIRLLRGSP